MDCLLLDPPTNIAYLISFQFPHLICFTRSPKLVSPSFMHLFHCLHAFTKKLALIRSVRISDRALVVAAELSDRYITTRFLPDKAIDLWVVYQ